jgi:hypothetical protein
MEFQIFRTGKRPLAFEGELIVEQAGPMFQERNNSRHVDVRLYRTAGGRFVVERQFVSYNKGEIDDGDAMAVDSLDAAATWLKCWSPMDLSTGTVTYLNEEPHLTKRLFILGRLEEMYGFRVMQVLAGLGIVERIA